MKGFSDAIIEAHGRVVLGNRRQRRAQGAGNEKVPVPALRISVAKIDPVARTVVMETIDMTPASAQVFMGKLGWQYATIGHENGADVIIMGDTKPQVAILGDPEPLWMLRGSNFGPGPICHGIGGVLGMLPKAQKATSLPIGVEWVLERIVWDPQPDQE